METDLILRLAWTIGLIAAGFAIYKLTNRLIFARASGKARSLPAYRPGRAAILYFTTPTCAPCKTVQRPALERLKNHLGEGIQVIEVDASTNPGLASDWGVLSVPTTFIIDPQGQPRHINHGVTTAEKLKKQIMEFIK